MRKLTIGMHHINVTQRQWNSARQSSHWGIPAVDLAGSDSGIDFFKALDGAFKIIGFWGTSGGTGFIPVDASGKPEKVLLADGKEYYAGLYMVHDSTARKLGAIIPKGGVLYQEGTKGKATGNHIHLEVFRYDPEHPILPKRVAVKGNVYGSYMFQDYLDPSMLWIDRSYSTIVSLNGQSFGYYNSLADKPQAVIHEGLQSMLYGKVAIDLYVQKAGQDIGMISAQGVQRLKAIDDDRVHACKVNANRFRMDTGEHLGVEITPQRQDVPRQGKNYLAFYVDKDDVPHYCWSTDFWLTRDEVKFACSPDAVILWDGVDQDIVQASSGGRERLTQVTNQTLCMRLKDGRYAFAVTSPVSLMSLRAWCKSIGASEAVAMDGGGSVQMVVDGKYIRESNRAVANALTLYQAKKAQNQPDSKPQDDEKSKDEETIAELKKRTEEAEKAAKLQGAKVERVKAALLELMKIFDEEKKEEEKNV